MSGEERPTIGTIMELIIAYSPENLDIVEAIENAQDMLVDSVVLKGDINPLELKAVVETGLKARLDILVGMVINLTASLLEWPIEEADQEREALRDGLTLVKHHVERLRIEELTIMEVDDGDSDQDEEV